MYSSIPNIVCRLLSFVIFGFYTTFGFREVYFAQYLTHFVIHYHFAVESILNSNPIADFL
jgi:hypothetical protein